MISIRMNYQKALGRTIIENNEPWYEALEVTEDNKSDIEKMISPFGLKFKHLLFAQYNKRMPNGYFVYVRGNDVVLGDKDHYDIKD